MVFYYNEAERKKGRFIWKLQLVKGITYNVSHTR